MLPRAISHGRAWAVTLVMLQFTPQPLMGYQIITSQHQSQSTHKTTCSHAVVFAGFSEFRHADHEFASSLFLRLITVHFSPMQTTESLGHSQPMHRVAPFNHAGVWQVTRRLGLTDVLSHVPHEDLTAWYSANIADS